MTLRMCRKDLTARPLTRIGEDTFREDNTVPKFEE
jgi:hypothetical protein